MINNVFIFISNHVFLVWYILAVNVATFILYGVDKVLAISRSSRISESTLIMLSIIGGSIGALLGMKIFHHKTLKPLFIIAIPLIIIIQIIVLLIVSNS